MLKKAGGLVKLQHPDKKEATGEQWCKETDKAAMQARRRATARQKLGGAATKKFLKK